MAANQKGVVTKVKGVGEVGRRIRDMGIAKGVLINITGSTDLGLYEINEAASLVYDLVSEDANIILGSVIDQDMGEDIMVTVIATGFEGPCISDNADNNIVSYEQEQAYHVQAHAAQVKQEVDQRIHGIHGARKEVRLRAAEQHKPEKIQQQPVPQHRQEEEVSVATQQVPAAAEVKRHEQSEQPVVQPVQQEASYDLHDLDTPTYLRKKAEQRQQVAAAEEKPKNQQDSPESDQIHVKPAEAKGDVKEEYKAEQNRGQYQEESPQPLNRRERRELKRRERYYQNMK